MIQEFLLLGAIILAGFFGSVLFERTKIPDALLLLLLGLVIGPVMGIVDASQFVGWAPFVGTLALIVVLLEAGFKLDLAEVISSLPSAGVFSFAASVVAALAAAGVLHYAFGWPVLHALFAGVIFSGYASNILLPIVSRLSASSGARMLMSLESVMNDVFNIVFAFILLGLMAGQGAIDYSQAVKDLASAFTTAIVAGFVAGVFWMKVLRTFQGKSLGYVVTLAVAFILYAFTEAVGGNGAIAALVFGLALGNGPRLAEAFKWKGDYAVGESLKGVQSAVSFFVNTFFFVYLGLLFELHALNEQILLVAAGLIFALYAGRAIAVYALTRANPSLKPDSRLLLWLVPRGLTAAVLAFLPANQGIAIPQLADLAFIVILASNAFAGVASYAFERSKKSEAVKPKAPKPRIVQ